MTPLKVCCISDLHGFLPIIPECDICIIAGDVCPDSSIELQLGWLNSMFRIWLESIKAKKIIGVFGNHDRIGEIPVLVPSLPWILLQDDFFEFENYKIYGMPWTLKYHGVFNLSEEEFQRKCGFIPEDIDILISHSPPYKVGDYTKDGCSAGSKSLYERIVEVCPSIVVVGHLHESRGIYDMGCSFVINASLRDVNYDPTNPPILIELKGKEVKILYK